MDHNNESIMDFVIKEEFEIKQEREEFETNDRVIQFNHIFQPEPIKEENQENSITLKYSHFPPEPIKEENEKNSIILESIDIKLEPIEEELQQGSGTLKNSNIKLEPIFFDHNYACVYQSLKERASPRRAVKLKSKSRPSEPFEPQNCSICDEHFVRYSSFERHLISHGTSRSPFECDVCGVKCKLKKHLRRHILSLHAIPNMRVPCNICGKFFHRNYLKLHRSRHNILNQTPSHECTICGKFFHIRANLTSHIRTHRKKKTAPCKVCGKSFVVPEPLRIHERIHTGEKPYLCWICGLRFRGRNTFFTHQTVHWTGKNFPCRICGLKFKNPNCLNSHKKKVHSEKIAKTKIIKEIKLPVSLIKQEDDITPNIYVNIRTYSKYNRNS